MNKQVDANGLIKYISDQSSKIGMAFKEIEELQKLYQGSYTKFKADHDKTLLALVDKIKAQSDGLATALQAQIDAETPTAKKAITHRIAELEQDKIPTVTKQADDLLARARRQADDLRKENPRLNDQEEKLKAQIAKWQKQLDDLNAQVQQLASGLGFIFNTLKIHELDGKRHQAVGRLEELNANLAKVRQDWKELRAVAAGETVDWQGQWRMAMAEVGQLRQEHDYLTQNIDAESRHRAIVSVVDNLKELPAGVDHGDLKKMVALNIQTDDFQAALGSVASILGVVKSIDDGLGRIRESVTALAAEQSRHSAYLPSLQFDLPDNVVAFDKTWDDLVARTKDEKALGQHPAVFVTAVQPFLDQRLTKEHITEFFDGLGGVLKKSTSGWRGK